MAKEEKEEKQTREGQEEEQKDEGTKEASRSFGLYTWLIIAAITIAGITGGFALAQLLGGTTVPQPSETQATESGEILNKNFEELVSEENDNKVWTFDLDPVVATLDEPGLMRYVRATIILELSPKMKGEKGLLYLEEKKLILLDWLTTYLAGQNLEQVRGSRNYSRIKKEIRDQFNELLFPQSAPYVLGILFKEFAIT